MSKIRTRMTCYRLFENERGFSDWERYPKFDREVMITPDEARTIAHGLTEAAGYASKHRGVGE